MHGGTIKIAKFNSLPLWFTLVNVPKKNQHFCCKYFYIRHTQFLQTDRQT